MIGTPRLGRMSRGIWRKAMRPAKTTAAMATTTVIGRRIAARGRVIGIPLSGDARPGRPPSRWTSLSFPRLPLSRAGGGCSGSEVTRERLIQVVEEGEAPFEACLVFGVCGQHAQQELLDSSCLGTTELVVLDVDVVDDLGDAGERGVRRLDAAHEGLEGAAVLLVREVGAHHIEGQLAGTRLLRVGIDEAETRLGINEPADKPCRGDSVDLDTAARDPSAADQLAVRLRPHEPRCPGVRREPSREHSERGFGLRPPRRLEEVDTADLLEAPSGVAKPNAEGSA